jgi:hypothetical protein
MELKHRRSGRLSAPIAVYSETTIVRSEMRRPWSGDNVFRHWRYCWGLGVPQFELKGGMEISKFNADTEFGQKVVPKAR